MSYAQRQPIRASRTIAIAIVALCQASLGYALASSLAYSVVPSIPDGLKTFNVEEVQPPPPERRTAPKRVFERRPQVQTPPAAVRTDPVRLASDQNALATLPPEVAPTVAPEPSPPQPAPSPPPVQAVPPHSATGDLQGLFRPSDYPFGALERREQGSVTVRLSVGATGHVSACDIAASSGSRRLDEASCRILQSRALFTPARDGSGNPTTDTVVQEVRWMLG